MDDSAVHFLTNLFDADRGPFVVAVVAIAGFTLIGCLRAFAQHRERMAMIRQGMHPDAKQNKKAGEKSANVKSAPAKDDAGWSDYKNSQV